MQNSESAAAVSADMDRIFEGVSRDPLHRAAQMSGRPDLAMSGAEPIRDDRKLSILTRLVTPLIVIVAIIACIVMALNTYSRRPAPALASGSHAELAPQIRMIPPGSLRPSGATSAVDRHDHLAASAHSKASQAQPAKISTDAGGNAHSRQKARRLDVAVRRHDCASYITRGCTSGSMREADARLRRAYLDAISRGVSGSHIRKIRREWLKARRDYGRHPRSAIRRYDSLRQHILAGGHH